MFNKGKYGHIGKVSSDRDKMDVKKVCDIIVEIWRLKNKLKRLLSAKLNAEEKRILEEQLERIDNVLDMHDIKVEDYLKKEYNDNMTSVKKILQREDSSLSQNQRIISDVSFPEIRYKDKVVMRAEVIVSIGTKPKGGK